MDSQSEALKEKEIKIKLNKQQTDDLTNLMEFVNCDDEERCLALLKKHDWNLNVKII